VQVIGLPVMVRMDVRVDEAHLRTVELAATAVEQETTVL